MAEKKRENVHTSIVTPRAKNTSGVVGEGDIVLVHYTGTLPSGEEFDSSRGKEPLEFAVGARAVIPGFDRAMIGMRVGERKDVEIVPEHAYGEANDELRQRIPRAALGEITPEVGMMLALQHPAMPQPVPAKIVSFDEESVTLDLNHPLAGKTLRFAVELVEIR